MVIHREPTLLSHIVVREDGAAELLASYDLVPPVELAALPHEGKNNGNALVRTGAGAFVAKTYVSLSYDDPASIDYEHHLLAWLAGAGLSFDVPMPIAARDGALLVHGPHGPMSLSRLLPGVRLDALAPDQIELLGATLGELQAALRRYPAAPRPGRPLFGALFGFPPPPRDPFTLTPEQLGLPSAPPYDGLLRWWREEAARLRAFVDGPYRALPRQLCHNDVTPANVLVAAGRVSAVLDFEFATLAARALDVAMGLRMTTWVWENPEPWDEVRRFCRGYTRWMPLTEAEAEAMSWLMRLRAATAIVWWIGRTAATGDAGPIPTNIAYLQRLVHWLDRYERRFVDVVMGAVG